MILSDSQKMKENAPSIVIDNGYLHYLNSKQPVLDKLNMHIPCSKWTCILGQSGCGKTTLLRYLAGIINEQVVWNGDLSISNQIPLQEQVAYMAQQDLLMPWLSVLENVLLSDKFSQRPRQKNKQQKQQQVEKATYLLQQVGLADKAQQRPQNLSGGMRQRVALARTLMQDKPVVLMDEPFSALDAVTRHKLQNLAHQLLKDKTVILITHEPQEAIRLADQLYILQGQPASAKVLTLPDTEAPRAFSEETALLQQNIIESLEQSDIQPNNPEKIHG